MKAVIIVALAWMYLCSIGFRRYQRKEAREKILTRHEPSLFC